MGYRDQILKQIKPGVSESQPIQNETVRHGDLDWWAEQLDKTPVEAWSLSKAERLKHSPHETISPYIRAQLVYDAISKLPKAEIEHGTPVGDQHQTWMKEFKQRHAALFKAQADAVLMFSETVVSLRCNTQIGQGPKWKRGTRGNTLPDRALEMFPTEIAEAFRLRLRDFPGNILVHIDGFICTLPKEDLRFPKK